MITVIGTTNIERKILIIIGQSNAVGVGRASELTGLDTLYGETLEAVRYMSSTGNDANPPLVVSYPASGLEPKIGTNGILSFGVEMTMGRSLNAATPERWSVGKIARSSTSLYVDWDPDGTWPSLDPSGKNIFNQSIDYALQAQIDLGGRVVGFVWIQGEGDALALVSANAYGANLVNLAQRYAAYFPSALFWYGRLHIDSNEPYTPEVRTQQESVDGIGTLRMIDMDGVPLGSDQVHFNTAGYLELGDVFALPIATQFVQHIPPQVQFSTDIVALAVTFTSVTKTVGSTAVAWLWDFGDGATSTLENPTHTYADTGTYNVTLTVADAEAYTGVSPTLPISVLAGIPGVTRDFLSHRYVPKDNTEVRTFLDALGLNAKDTSLGVMLLQEASPNNFAVTGQVYQLIPVGPPTYQSVMTGMSRVGVKCAEGSSQNFATTNSALPNIATDSFFVIAQILMPPSAPASNRAIISIGVGANRAHVGIEGSTGKLRVTSGANVALSPANVCDATVQTVAIRVNRGSLECDGFIGSIKVTPTALSSMSGKSLAFGAQPSALGPGGTTFGHAILFGLQDWSDAEIATLITGIGP